MPEFRTDWLTGRSVIIAENRALRPNEFDSLVPSVQNQANAALAEVGLATLSGVPSCPFCVGNEAKTPASLYEQHDSEGNWTLRVIPNAFPAVTLNGEAPPGEAIAARGEQEVIVESARHRDRTADLSLEEFTRVLAAYVQRLRHWSRDERLAYGLIFKNQGPRAGASIAHLHSQFVAFPEVPPLAAAELRRAAEHFQKDGLCPYCRLIDQERSSGERVVYEEDGFIAFCPYASIQPHEVWVLPTRHETSFEQEVDENALAPGLYRLIGRLEELIPDAAYNMLLHTAPWRSDCQKWFHWRIELVPRSTSIAGFEIATGLNINPLAPERAAGKLRPV